MNAYHFSGVAYSSGDRIKVQGLDDKRLNGKHGTIVSISSGGCRIRFGNIAEGVSYVILHPAVLRKVVAA